MNKLRAGSIYVQAVENLCGGAHFTLQGDDAYENIISWTGNQTKIPTSEEVDTEVARLTALKYQLQRQGQDYSDPDVDLTDGVYPDLGEQLDLLYHDIEAGTLTTSGNFYKTLKAVKDKFPKPS